MISESGSLAALGLPQSEGPNTYSSLNQIASWNGTAAGADLNGNLTGDPASGAAYAWDSRNQLASISGGPAGSFGAQYDALTRRYDQTTAYGGTTTYLHDGKTVAQSTNGCAIGCSNSSNAYLTLPGTGEALAATLASGGTSNTYVPLTDALGSTLALVNSSGGVAAQYTYDPFGNVAASGQSLAYPYQYAGMALDPSGLYFNGRGYYSPALGRALEGYGAPHAPGAGQGGGAGLPSSGGGGLSATGAAGNAAIGIGAGAAVIVAGAVAANAVWVGDITIVGAIGAAAGGPVGIIAAAVVAIVAAALDLFGVDLFGGGSRPTPPPMDYRFFHYPSATFIGVPLVLVPNMNDSAPAEVAEIFATAAPSVDANNVDLIKYVIPFKNLPLDPNDSPGEEWVRKGRNWTNPQTKQSLSPDFDHQPPKGPHYDLHNRYPKWSLSIRPSPDGHSLQFWDQDLMEWLPLELLPE